MKGGKLNFKKKIHRGIRKKYCIRSQIFRYELPEDFLSKWQKKLKETDGQTCRLPNWFLALHFAAKKLSNGEFIFYADLELVTISNI